MNIAIVGASGAVGAAPGVSTRTAAAISKWNFLELTAMPSVASMWLLYRQARRLRANTPT